MKILFIAPLPNPINGQSKASKVLLDKLIIEENNISIVDLSKKSLKTGISSLNRVFEVFNVLIKVWKKRKKNDIIYFSLAESFFGNLRDLFIYTLCYRNIDKIFIHMLGGAGMKLILEGEGLRNKINRFFIKKIGGVIVEGDVNFSVFSKVVNENKIHIVPNFAEDFLFVKDEEIKAKFLNKSNIQILYLSNLIHGKGYAELVDAYAELNENDKKRINIVFAGGFGTEKNKNKFLKRIKSFEGLKYVGKFIDGDKKRKLYCQSQVFCLPTYYPFEGQPISILEAYATGCVVITSDHSGIPYIFSDKKNGYIVEKKSVPSLKKAIENTLLNINNLEDIAFHNRNEAVKKYRTSIYQDKIMKILNDFNDE